TIDVPDDADALGRLAYGGRLGPAASGLDGFQYVARNEAGASNPVLLNYATAPVVLDAGSNDSAEAAQEVAPPCEIAGRIEARGDRDLYAFAARAGQVLSIEAVGDRLGWPVDLYLVLRDAAGTVLGESDEDPEVLAPAQFPTRSDDPGRLRFVAPADGRYVLTVSCRLAPLLAGPRQIYRVRIGPERPDFRLVVLPSIGGGPGGWAVGRGGRMDALVLIWRRDGFGGPVTLTAEGLPPGVTCPPQLVGPGLKQAALIVRAETDAPTWTGPIRVRGTATIDGRTVAREARAASITWPVPQANVPAIARLDRELVLAVRDPPPFALALGREEATLAPGEKLTVPLKLTRLWPDLKAPVQVTASSFPPNLTAAPVGMAPGRDDAEIVLEARANAAPGVYSLVLRGQVPVPFSKDPAAKAKPNVTVTQPSAPLALTVLPRRSAR
ncbi:MAG TPA: PPC domain-containing protein, partial [Isosphaeraceae bacterium]